MVNRNRNLENRLKNRNNWAYTGSLAMKIHANRLNVPFPNKRNIGNINIALKTRPNKRIGILQLGILPVITKSRWELKTSPSNRHTKLYNKHSRNTLNLFPANGHLAPKFIHVQRFNGFPPVMSIKSLLNQKRNMNTNGLRTNDIMKIQKNISFLNSLLKKNTTSPPRRSPSRSPTPSPRRRVSRNRSPNNNYNPFGPPRNLFNNTRRKLGF